MYIYAYVCAYMNAYMYVYMGYPKKKTNFTIVKLSTICFYWRARPITSSVDKKGGWDYLLYRVGGGSVRKRKREITFLCT